MTLTRLEDAILHLMRTVDQITLLQRLTLSSVPEDEWRYEAGIVLGGISDGLKSVKKRLIAAERRQVAAPRRLVAACRAVKR